MKATVVRRKGRTGLPLVSPMEAIEYAKKAYSSIGKKEKSFAGMAEVMDMKEAYAKLALGVLSNNYGLLALENGAWKVTDLGERVAIGDKSAVIEMILRISILAELYNYFKDRDIDKDLIEDYINKKKQGLKASLITDRYLEVMKYTNTLGNAFVKSDFKDHKHDKIITDTIEMLRLMYNLFPSTEKKDLNDEINDLIVLAEKSGYSHFAHFLNGAKFLIKSREDLNKISEHAISLFEKDSGLVLYPSLESNIIEGHKRKQELSHELEKELNKIETHKKKRQTPENETK